MTTDSFDSVMKTTNLQRYEVAIQAILPNEMAFVRNHLQIDTETVVLESVRTCLLHLRSFLLRSTQKKMGTGAYEVPASWWQHLKESHFPVWLLRRFPVNYTICTYTFEQEIRLCPHADIKWRDGHQHIMFLSGEDLHG